MFYRQQVVAFLLRHLQQSFGTPVGIASASLSLIFSLSTGLVKLLLKQQEIRKRA